LVGSDSRYALRGEKGGGLHWVSGRERKGQNRKKRYRKGKWVNGVMGREEKEKGSDREERRKENGRQGFIKGGGAWGLRISRGWGERGMGERPKFAKNPTGDGSRGGRGIVEGELPSRGQGGKNKPGRGRRAVL